MAKIRWKFQVKQTATTVQVWLGNPGEPESELVCEVALTLVPALIAALKSVLK